MLNLFSILVSFLGFIGFWIKFKVLSDVIFLWVLGWILLDIIIILVLRFCFWIVFNVLYLFKMGILRLSNRRLFFFLVRVDRVFWLFFVKCMVIF